MRKKIIILVVVIAIMVLVPLLVCLNKGHQGLTTKEKVEDFKYLVKTFEDNYCNFDIFYNKYGIDFRNLNEDVEESIKNSSSDVEFYNILDSYLGILDDSHIGILNPIEREYFLSAYEGDSYTYNILSDKTVDDKYKYWEDVVGYTENMIDLSAKIENKMMSNSENENIVTKEIDKDIAYMKISSFEGFSDKDINTISEFYRNINNYDNFIIDIRGNGGGDESMWQDYIISPIIDRSYQVDNYSLHKGGEITEEYYKSKNIFSHFKTIDEFPDKDLLTKVKDINQYKYFNVNTKIVQPYYNKLSYKPDAYEGNIYLLVDNEVFSSAEGFAILAKESNWAKVVGENTRGDGIGIAPTLFTLPNSKLIVRITTEKGLNSDGSNNAEVGTTVDMKISSLDELVEYIKNK